MADNIDINVNVNTSQAQRNLNNLNKRLDDVNKSFGGLKSVLGGLAIGTIVNNLLNFAASMVDVANSTDIALETVIGFSRAVQQNGGDIAGAQQALQKFNVTIGEAAQGSAGAQEAFSKVGVSLDDLRSLSQQDLLRKTIQGLNQIQDASLRAKLASELLGKSFREIDLKGLANDYDGAIRGSKSYVEAVRTADQVQNNLEKSLSDLTIALLVILQPIGELAKSINTNIDTIIKWGSAILEFGKVVAVFFVVGRVVGLLVKGFALLSGGIAGLIAGAAGIMRTFGAFTTQLKAVVKEGAITSETFKGLQKRWKYLQDEIPLLANGIAVISAALYGAYAAGKKFLGLQEDLSGPVVIQGEGAQAIPEGYFEKRREQLRQVTEALLKEKQAIQEVTAAYQRSNAEQIATINLQRLSLDMSRDEVDVMNAVDQVIKRNEESIRKLKDQKASLASDSPLIGAINAEIKKLEESLETDKRVTAEAVRNLQTRQLEQEKLNLILEETKQRISDSQSLQTLQTQLAVIGQYGDQLENNLMILQVTEELQRKLTDLEVGRLELENQRTQLGETRFAQEMAHLEALRNAAYEYAGARLEGEQKILEAQRATREDAQLGVEQAVADIAKQFEPYNMAQEAVKKGWDAIGNAVDQFVETGKFKFSDFARSVIQDLAKMIAKAMIFKAISSALGAFGISIPGLASGGPVEKGQPYIVGEKGPELFVPQGAGQIIPNNKLGGNNGANTNVPTGPITNNYNTYNINALDAKSVAQLFAENRKAIFGANKMAEREMSYVGAR
jgi:lambda family phage tail tape measure protein